MLMAMGLLTLALAPIHRVKIRSAPAVSVTPRASSKYLHVGSSRRPDASVRTRIASGRALICRQLDQPRPPVVPTHQQRPRACMLAGSQNGGALPARELVAGDHPFQGI